MFEDLFFAAIFSILFCTVGVFALRWCDEHYKVKLEIDESQRIIRECEFKKVTWTRKWGGESMEYLCPDGSYVTIGPNH